MYRSFDVEIEFLGRIYGGLPKNKDIFEQYAKSKFPDKEAADHVATDLDLDEELEKRTVGFKKDETGIYIGAYQIEAMLSQSASLLEITVKKRGSKQTIREGMVVKGMNEKNEYTGAKVYLMPYKTEPDGLETHAGNVTTAQGNRSILKKLEYVENATARFNMIFLKNRIGDDGRSSKILVDDVKKSLRHGQELGLGSHRRYGGGRFKVLNFKEVEFIDDDFDF